MSCIEFPLFYTYNGRYLYDGSIKFGFLVASEAAQLYGSSFVTRLQVQIHLVYLMHLEGLQVGQIKK